MPRQKVSNRMAKTESDKLAKVESKYSVLVPVEDGPSPMEIININLGGAVDPKHLTRIKCPSGGALAFEVPNLSGEVDYEKKLEGIIVGIGTKRVYYSTKYTGGSEPPDCYSEDGITGIAREGCPLGGNCKTCPMGGDDAWGTATDEKGNPTRGKACQERKIILLMTEDSLLPLMIDCPTGSLGSITKYLTDLSAAQKLYFHVVTAIKLRKETSGGGVDYSVLTPGIVRDLTPAEKKGAFSVWTTMNKMVNRATIEETIATEDEPW